MQSKIDVDEMWMRCIKYVLRKSTHLKAAITILVIRAPAAVMMISV